MSKGLRLLSAIALLAAAVALSLPASADGLSSGAGTSLVRGGAVLPHFDFEPLHRDQRRRGAAAQPAPRDFAELSRSQRAALPVLATDGVGRDRTVLAQTVTGNYAGLAWNVFDYDQLFGNVALSGAVNRQALDEPAQRLYGPLLSLHSTFELGYAFERATDLSLALDHSGSSDLFRRLSSVSVMGIIFRA